MTIAICVQQYLALDVVDGSAATVSSRNPSIWPTAGSVPEYAYKSLGTLWMGKPVSSSQLLTRINYQFGEGKTSAPGEISLQTAPIESTRIPEPLYSNNTGAETTFLNIVLRQPENEMSVARMTNVELRIRYLLDYLWRSKRRGGGILPISPAIPVIGDNSISQDLPPLCLWMEYLTIPSATETGVRYVIAYQRNVPR